MDYLDLRNLLNVIDNRIKKIISTEKFLKEYIGKVEIIYPNGDCLVKIYNNETPLILKNKSGDRLFSGDDVYIVTNGNDLNTGFISRKLSRSPLPQVDFILEEGQKDGWNYRKWNNGVAECWTRTEFQVNSMDTWGSLFSGAITFSGKPNINYPFTFKENPVCNVSTEGIPSKYNFMICTRVDTVSGEGTTEHPPVYQIIRPTIIEPENLPFSGYLHYQVIGKWK